jgi:hypothetical protein
LPVLCSRHVPAGSRVFLLSSHPHRSRRTPVRKVGAVTNSFLGHLTLFFFFFFGRIDASHDVFGRERHHQNREDMGGVGSFESDSCTLYVGGLGQHKNLGCNIDPSASSCHFLLNFSFSLSLSLSLSRSSLWVRGNVVARVWRVGHAAGNQDCRAFGGGLCPLPQPPQCRDGHGSHVVRSLFSWLPLLAFFMAFSSSALFFLPSFPTQ